MDFDAVNSFALSTTSLKRSILPMPRFSLPNAERGAVQERLKLADKLNKATKDRIEDGYQRQGETKSPNCCSAEFNWEGKEFW